MDLWPSCLSIRGLWSEDPGSSLPPPPTAPWVEEECWVGYMWKYRTIENKNTVVAELG